MQAMRRCEVCEERPPSIKCKERLMCYGCSRRCQNDQPHPHEFIHHGSIMQRQEEEEVSIQPVLMTQRPRQEVQKVLLQENNSSLANLRLRTGYSECQVLTERHNSLSRYVRRRSSEKHLPFVPLFTQREEKAQESQQQQSNTIHMNQQRIVVNQPTILTRNRHTQTDSPPVTQQSSCQTSPAISSQETIDRLRRRLKDEREKNHHQNEAYKKKLELIRSCLKPELFDLQRLISENQQLRQRVLQLELITPARTPAPVDDL